MTEGTALPAAAQAPSGRDGTAWALAALPLASAMLLAVLVLLDVADDMRSLSAVTLLASVAFVLADRQRLQRSGVAVSGMPPAWWSVVPLAYLWKRAAALGRPRTPFWAWLGSAAAASPPSGSPCWSRSPRRPPRSAPRPGACRTACESAWKSVPAYGVISVETGPTPGM